MYFDGYTNNKWGDGVINALERMGFNPIISHCAGEFYLDFLDKVITIVLLFLLIRFYKSRKKCKKCSDRNPVVSDPWRLRCFREWGSSFGACKGEKRGTGREQL